MAYKFVAANSQHLEGTVSGLNPPFTMMAWSQRSATSGDIRPIMAVQVSTNNNIHQLHLVSNALRCAIGTRRSFISGTMAVATSAATETLNDWNHSLGILEASNSRRAYMNTSVGTTNTDDRNISPTVFRVGRGTVITGNATIVYMNGLVGEVAVWQAVLTDDEIASLNKGFKPTRIRPQSLLYYLPLVRNIQELCSGVTLTESASAPTPIDHPRVY